MLQVEQEKCVENSFCLASEKELNWSEINAAADRLDASHYFLFRLFDDMDGQQLHSFQLHRLSLSLFLLWPLNVNVPEMMGRVSRVQIVQL